MFGFKILVKFVVDLKKFQESVDVDDIDLGIEYLIYEFLFFFCIFWISNCVDCVVYWIKNFVFVEVESVSIVLYIG